MIPGAKNVLTLFQRYQDRWEMSILFNYLSVPQQEPFKLIVMNSAELRNLQAPLKEKYSLQPESAIITLKAEGKKRWVKVYRVR